MSKKAMKLALEALEYTTTVANFLLGNEKDIGPMLKAREAITALREALAEQPAQQDSTCSNALRAQGKAYPRTCKKCGLGPCVELAQQALGKMAENARELGLDYEPARDSGIVTAGGADPRTQRTWVGLSDLNIDELENNYMKSAQTAHEFLRAIEAKLKEKNT